jgi:Dullard-like phosphatase family protein
LVYINLLIVLSSIKNKIKIDNRDHYNLRLIEMSNVDKIIGQNLINFNNNIYNEDNISFNRELLNNNTNLLIKNISLIIKNYKQLNITNLFYRIKTSTLDEINTFFRQNIIREDFLGCSVLASTYLKEKQNFMPGKVPYISKKNNKKYSLVLDLDETLIHFKVKHGQNDEGVLKLRPGVFTFLEKVKQYYEIILFTEASEAYTELLMEAFNKKKYFDYKLYRQHTIIIGQDFVKDLQKIGRPLDKVIIIDNIAQNFRMQKANGINIKPFFGEDKEDQALIDLIPILINIAKENLDTRNGLIKYRDEIITKITSNLYGRNV